MADEAFALSPISARATLPSEQDYDAIREAFMETSRGRWFLGEYAKRNRNADTRMVLEAVERIEEAIATQQRPEPAPNNGLAEALAAITTVLGQARATASSTIDDLAPGQHLVQVRKGARVIREISWRLREIGADARICDLIDSQISAIEAACGHIASADPKAALSPAFNLVEGLIAALATPGELAAPPHKPVATPSSPRPRGSSEVPTSTPKDRQAASATKNAETAIGTRAMPVQTVVAANEAADLMAEAVDVSSQVAEAAAGPAEMSAEAAAYDEALLDMIALEMAAPEPVVTGELAGVETAEMQVSTPPPADTEISAPRAEPKATPAPPAQVRPTLRSSAKASLLAAAERPLELSREPSVEPSREPSVGATVLANGLVRRLSAAASDPLAPIRRMSQVEKIAFFS